jgi:hypothetical protein
MTTVATLLALGAGTLFVVQNSARTTQLSFNLLGLAAWQLERPMPVPALMGVSAGVGFGVGLILLGVVSGRQATRIRKLEQQIAISGVRPKPEDKKSW